MGSPVWAVTRKEFAVNRSRWIAPVATLFFLASVAAPAAGVDYPPVITAGPPAPAVVWTLEDVTDIALKNHPLVKAADADTVAAEARKGQAESAWYPSLNLTTGYSRVRAGNGTTQQDRTRSNTFIGGTASWMLYDFGRTGATVGRADALAAASRETAVTTRDDVVFVAKVAFYNVLRTQKTMEFQRENLRQRESLLRQATAFYEAGIRARIDVARAEANLYDARARVSQAENELRVARITLLQRIGVDGPPEFGLSGQLPEMSLPGTLPDWIAEAEQNRPELRTLLEQERAAVESLRFARSNYYPYLSGAAGYGYDADNFPLQENSTVAVTLNYPLFSGFQTREQVKEASATISSTRYQITEARRRVRLEVERSAYGVQEAQERLEARKKEREASEENLRLATARYEVGAGDIIEMTDAQAQMVQSDTETINSAFDYAVSHASLLRAMGR